MNAPLVELTERWREFETRTEKGSKLTFSRGMPPEERDTYYDGNRARRERDALRDAARDAWAAARGLKPSPRQTEIDFFRAYVRAGGRPVACHYLLDHSDTVWIRDRKLACLTAHPYYDIRGPGEEDAASLRANGFTVTVHPKEELASWYWPGATVLVEIWRPGVDPDFRVNP